MRRREHEAVPRDRAQDVARLGQHPSLVVRHVDGLDAEPELAQLVLEPRPLRAPCRRASGPSGPAVSAGESTVGIQTMRAPSRAAISTASAFIPPTAWFSVSVPSTRTPGTTPETTCARSAVDV